MSGPLSLGIEEKLKLESWGLPKFILQKYRSKGLHSMFPWQLECLTSGNVLNGGNLVYSAPTSAGKTLIAEILTFQTVLEKKKKVIIILPFVSVVREKVLYFQDLLVGSGIRVEGFMGSYNPPGGFRAVHVAICTIEKANSLINRLLEETNFDNIGCVVVDELHLLGDPHRGYLLELLLTKLKYISKKGLCSPIQIVGMSATLPNLDVLAKWLDATLYKTDFRPIPLIEFMKVNRCIYKTTDLTSGESFEPEFSIDNDPGDAIYLCIDTILKGYSVLVFCPTKNWCETLALQIAGEVKRLGCSNHDLAVEIRKQLNSEAISDTLQQLKNSPVGLESVLGKCVSFGVAYHHAGLTLDERDIIEGGFRRSVLRVLVATSTLSSGVNLPARRVIIRSPLFNGRMMDILSYKQMVGRAGRMGKDTAGESYLLCTEEQKSQGQRLVHSALPSVESCLGHSDLSNSLKRAVLEVVASGLISSYEEVRCYTNCTLLAAYEDSEKINQAVQKCMKYLTAKGFIELKNETEISVSSLAEACLSASMTPDQGLALLAELDKARKCFVLDSDLHAVYQVTPFSVSNQWSLDWMKAFSMWEALPKNVQKIGQMVGVDERFLIKAMRGTMNFQADDQAQKIAIHRRFFTALALQDLINEIPLNKVAEKYGCNKGVLQSLQQSASTFSGMVTNFCRKLSWGAMEVVVSQLGQRIQFGAHRDLLDLLRLECMTGAMARGLYNCSITTVSEVAQSSVKQICTAIRKALPYTSSDDPGKGKERRDIYLPGRPGLTELEAAELFIKEARMFLMREMGIEHVNWNESKFPEDEPTTTISDRTTRVEESQGSLLNLSVSSADFQNLKTGSQNFKIGLEDNIASTSTQISVAPESKQTNKFEGLGEPAIVDYAGQDNEMDDSAKDDHDALIPPTPEIKPTDVPEATGECIVTSDPYRLHLSQDDLMDKAEEVYRDSISDEGEDSEVMKSSKFSSLLNISNPCIPKLDSTLRSPSSSCSETEHEVMMSEDIVVPASQEVHPPQSNLKNNSEVVLSSSKSELPNKDGTEFKDTADYNNLHFSNFSKAFDSTFVHNSPSEGGKSVLMKLNPSIKSSTPFHTPESKIAEKIEENAFLEMKKLGSVTSILGLTTIKPDSSFRTPESRFSDAIQGRLTNSATVKISPAVSEFSDADMFADTDAADNKLSYSMLCDINSDKLLEELDSNMGGDSILLASQIFESQNDNSIGRNTLKRSIGDVESIDHPWKRPYKKRCTSSVHKARAEESPFRESGISNYFTESLVLDTQVMNVVDVESSPLPLFPVEKKVIEPVESPLKLSSAAKNASSKPARNSLTDSYLAEAFQDSFKSCELKTTFEPGTPDIFDSPTNKTIVDRGPLKPFTNNGLVSSESAPASKNVTVDNQPSAISSPKKASFKSSAASPSKYPAVGVCVVKCSRSPGSPAGVSKKYSHSHRESLAVTSCKKSLLLSSGCVDHKNSNEADRNILDSPIAEELLPPVEPTCSKKLKKTKSETWGKNVSVDKELITGEETVPSSAPVASRISETKDVSGHHHFPADCNLFEVCKNNDKVEEFLRIFLGHKEAAFYLETSKINSGENKIGMRIINAKSEKNPDFHYNDIGIVGIYFCMGNEVFHCCLRSSKCICIDAVKSIFQAKYVTVIGFCLSWQLKLLFQCCGISAQCKFWDISAADWLLNPRDEKILLKQMSKEHLSSEDISRANLQRTQCASDTVMIWALKQKLSFKLQESGLLNHFMDTEMPIRLLLVYMELSGMPFDPNVAAQLWNRTRETMARLEDQIYLKARRRFNLSSRKDLKKVKESLNIKSEDTQNPFLINIHNWRKLHSLKTRSLSPLLMTPQTDGRCRGQSCSFTVTGRIVMHEPNLQHIPRDFTINNEVFSLRSAFIAKSGNVIISADYSQLELRILAHFSQDPDLIRSFQNEADVFVSIAAKWNKIPLDQVTEDLRHQTKQIIYGIIYGMGDRALGEALGVDPPEAALLAAKFRQSYPGVQRFIESCISSCRKQGFITTLTGRVRRLKGINSPNKSLRAQAERQAVNSTIQGSAADIAKSATVRIETKLRNLIPKRGPVLTPLSASHLILHLHDELMYEVSKEHAEIVKNLVKTEMSNTVQLKVPLPVVVKCGPSWGQLKKV